MSRKRYPLRVARTAFGIRAQDLRTLVRTAWWARRWVASLEAMRLGARLGRGRQYAVAGQVTELTVEGTHVEASVTGSRERPYRLTLDFTAVPSASVADALRREPMLLARLLTGDLPMEVEALFRAAGAPLFPQAAPLGRTPDGKSVYDVKMHCSCPDWSRPCKHLVAVLFLLGEDVARNPATLLALRGVDVEDLVADPEPPGEAEDGAFVLPAAAGGRPGALVARLGAIPFWRGGVRCVDALGKIYARVAPVAADAARSRSIDLRAP
ncbi:MAG: SWIM zinc finger family protein [Kiritimatiellia bacterium]